MAHLETAWSEDNYWKGFLPEHLRDSWGMFSVRGDGACWLRATGLFLFGSQRMHRQVQILGVILMLWGKMLKNYEHTKM